MNTIKYHIPDFLRHFKLNIILSDYMRKFPDYFHENVTIGSVYGTFPTSLWNGGRYFEGTCDPRVMQEVLRQFNGRGIPCRFTFTNPLLKEEHLSDPFCNAVLRMADNGMNEVIVASQLLEDYIREKYPRYKITSSTCKQIENKDKLTEELEKDYSLVVLDYNWNNKFDELEKMPHKDKIELLINACCTPNCKRRGEHYRNIGENHIRYAEVKKKDPKAPFKAEEFRCDQMLLHLYETTCYSTHIKPEDIYEKYVPMGYENFKIEGRSVPDLNVLENYVYYMVKPEFKDKVRLELLLALTGKHKYFM
ncbi:MAG: hypothetical protein IJ446_06505 [Oscillospiraceae bacterium]|nr:hypothetical protein [Oscillospiraceae bacterium]